MGRLAVVLFIALCFGMAGGSYALIVHQPSQTMRHAEPVEGTVTSTDVVSAGSDGGYEAVVVYEYTFEGETYTNDNIRLFGEPGFVSPGGAEQFLESYSAGESVTVHVDARDPSTSYLEKGSVGLTPWGIIVGLGLLGLLGVFALIADLSGADWVDIK